jgi:hypothetical protein
MPYERNTQTVLEASYTAAEPTTWDGTEFTDDDAAKAALGKPVATNVYELWTAEQLAALAYLTNDNDTDADYVYNTYRLMTDLNLNEKDWSPIGRNDYFHGTFDGRGHTISGLKVNNTVYTGLFGWLADGTIQYLMVEGSVAGKNNGTTSPYVGGIVGYVGSGATIKFCSFKGSLSATHDNEPIMSFPFYAGSIVGCYFLGGTISNCLGLASEIILGGASSEEGKKGGIVGLLGESGSLSYSYWLDELGDSAFGENWGTGNVSDVGTIDDFSSWLNGLNATPDTGVNTGAVVGGFKWVKNAVGELDLEAIDE